MSNFSKATNLVEFAIALVREDAAIAGTIQSTLDSLLALPAAKRDRAAQCLLDVLQSPMLRKGDGQRN